MSIILLVVVVLTLATLIVTNQAKFGKVPSGSRLERIKTSANYKNGAFQNQSHTPVMPEDVSMFKVMKDGMFNRSKRNVPKNVLPSVKPNLKNLDPEKDVLVWFGHSSYFMQVSGKRFLVDPVFSGHASPFSFTVKSFNGSDVYTAEDMPNIDFLVITHDHWDHLDYETVMKLKAKVGKIITGLGTGAHLEHWRFEPGKITELDWNEQAEIGPRFKITATPARHFSGRKFKRNQSLWCSFVLETPEKKIFIGGDSGYDTHFAKIGVEHGPFDLAVLECGQYNEYWKYIHEMPEQTVQAAIDLKTKMLMPVHWAKFALSMHAWDEPIARVTAEAERLNVPIVHPMIGELVELGRPVASGKWWKALD